MSVCTSRIARSVSSSVKLRRELPARPARRRVRLLSLVFHPLLREFRADDGDRERQEKQRHDHRARRDELPLRVDRDHVAVPHGHDRHDRPPERVPYGFERALRPFASARERLPVGREELVSVGAVARDVRLPRVHVLVLVVAPLLREHVDALPERVGHHGELSVVPPELHDSKHSDEPHRSEHPRAVQTAAGEDQTDVERQDRDEIDRVHRVLHKLFHIRRRRYPQQVLERENSDADALHDEQFKLPPRIILELVRGLQTERHAAQDDEKQDEHRAREREPGRVRVFEEDPHAPAKESNRLAEDVAAVVVDALVARRPRRRGQAHRLRTKRRRRFRFYRFRFYRFRFLLAPFLLLLFLLLLFVLLLGRRESLEAPPRPRRLRRRSGMERAVVVWVRQRERRDVSTHVRVRVHVVDHAQSSLVPHGLGLHREHEVREARFERGRALSDGVGVGGRV
eukprot:30723-Pelagococcus_subviridis.AAC.11